MKKDTTEKPRVRECVCGKMPVLVSVRVGRMYTCPDPVKCPGNLRTKWQKSELQAIEEWSGLVVGFTARNRKTVRR